MRFEPHSHSMGSNLRLLDSTNHPKDLLLRAIELNLSGIALTDHEFVGKIPDFFKAYEEIAEDYPNFKVAAGNEIYLCNTREKGQKYYHYILIAKNKEGWKVLRQLSSIAWLNLYTDRMERVVTLYSTLEEMVKKHPNCLIATTACLGGFLSSKTKDLILAEKGNNEQEVEKIHNEIVDFILWNKELFKDDFYIECAPGCSKEQIMVNKRLVSIAKCFDVKMVVGTDAHYLTKDKRYYHSSYLNSKGGEREVDAFYEYAYLQSNEEIIQNLRFSQFDDDFIQEMFNNSEEICDKIEKYSIWHKQTIPKVTVKEYPKSAWWGTNNDYADEMSRFPTLQEMFVSDDKINRYWINQCWENLEKKKGKWVDNLKYVERLEEEAVTKKIISEKLETNIFAYPVTLQHYMDFVWESGSIVGAGRGSSCAGLNHWLLGITQLDPIQWDFPWFRYLNEARVELPDIDFDICPSKKPIILQKIKEERKQYFNDDIDELSKENLGAVIVGTYGTETAKAAIETACRGYRSEKYPEGIDVDTGLYLASLIPVERGVVSDIKTVYYGNPEKNKRPIKSFVAEVDKYPNLLDIAIEIEGLIKQRGSHASGVILNNEDPYEFLAYMRAPSGEVVTQFDLHVCESLGATKYDFLATLVVEKITESIRLLKEDGEIEADLTLKEAYDKYFHPDVLPLQDKEVWKIVQKAEVLDLFQLDSEIGRQGAKSVLPKNIYELSSVNGLIRLMPQDKNDETPMNKYLRFRSNPTLWEREMDRYNLSEIEKFAVRKYLSRTFGIGISQEQLMLCLMDEDLCGFTIEEANAARKIIGKKLFDKIPGLRDQIWEKTSKDSTAEYLWQAVVAPGLGYSFSDIHSMAYSFIGFQTAYITRRWNPIYWNTACLIVNSGSLENDFEEGSAATQKKKSTDYAKIAKALGQIINNKIKISLIDINNSAYSFKPDAKNNVILFGLKSLNRLGEDNAKLIIKNRPYLGIKDFLSKCSINKAVMIMLIKAGAFDNLDREWASKINPNIRKVIMAYYLYIASSPKKRITLQNINGLIQANLLPQKYEKHKKIYLLNKEFKKNKNCQYYVIPNEKVLSFLEQYYDLEEIISINNSQYTISISKWENIYKNVCNELKIWTQDKQSEILEAYNKYLFMQEWEKYAQGTISYWEMESLCFYYHEHELANIDKDKYGIVNFFSLPAESLVASFFSRGGKQIPIYQLFRIAGTVIGKTDNRSNIALLTTDGVVNVKFTKEQYSKFNRQLSFIQEDGTKKVAEKGWFVRGTKLLITGYRRGDMFVAKTYANTAVHQIYKIEVTENGKDLNLVSERVTGAE